VEEAGEKDTRRLGWSFGTGFKFAVSLHLNEPDFPSRIGDSGLTHPRINIIELLMLCLFSLSSNNSATIQCKSVVKL